MQTNCDLIRSKEFYVPVGLGILIMSGMSLIIYAVTSLRDSQDKNEATPKFLAFLTMGGLLAGIPTAYGMKRACQNYNLEMQQPTGSTHHSPDSQHSQNPREAIHIAPPGNTN